MRRQVKSKSFNEYSERRPTFVSAGRSITKDRWVDSNRRVCLELWDSIFRSPYKSFLFEGFSFMLMVGSANIVTNAQNVWSPFSSPKPTNSRRSILFVRSGVHPVIIAANCERLDAAVQLQRLVRRHALVTAHTMDTMAQIWNSFFFLSFLISWRVSFRLVGYLLGSWRTVSEQLLRADC